MTTSKRTLAAAAALMLAVPASAARTIKFATLAPLGSTWMNVMTALAREVEAKTGGDLKFKFYAGGVAGDEKDVVMKIRIGELQGGAFTGVGLGEIAPETRLLDAPWLFRSRAELDLIRRDFGPELSAAVAKKGFVVLGWTDLGAVYVYSRDPIRGPDDMKREKMWVWSGDPIAEAAYRALGVSPIPLSVVDVMQSLQTGLINAVYGPPLGVVALQWFQRVKHIYPVPMAQSSGAVLVSKRFFDALPEKDRRVLVSVSAAQIGRLNALTAVENEKALKAMEKQGLTMDPMPGAATMRRYAELGREARGDLVGRLFSEDLLDRVEKELAGYRARASAKR
jgi:TRAP-type transport system periplasmic protein